MDYVTRPTLSRNSATVMTDPYLLKIENLTISFESGRQLVPIVDDVNFTIRPGRVLALVGESGSGKTIVSLSILRLLGKGVKITAGRRRAKPDGRSASRQRFRTNPASSTPPSDRTARTKTRGTRSK